MVGRLAASRNGSQPATPQTLNWESNPKHKQQKSFTSQVH